MSFKVKDLMINVGPMQDAASTCTYWTRTGGGGCVDSLFDHGTRAKHELSLLKAQLRRAATRA